MPKETSPKKQAGRDDRSGQFVVSPSEKAAIVKTIEDLKQVSRRIEESKRSSRKS